MKTRHRVLAAGLGIAIGLTRPAYSAEPLVGRASLLRGRASQAGTVRSQARLLRGKTPQLAQILKAQAADGHIADVLAHSKVNGNYYIVSDLHMGLGKVREGGAFDRQEDFTRPEVFVKTLDHIARQPGNNTLVVGGDWLDVLEHVDPESSLDQLKGAITQMVKGHGVEFKALANKMVHENLHLVAVRGNHDIRMIDSSELATTKTTVRDHFLDEIAKVAGLDEAQGKVLRSRFGFAGHMAPLGKYGELLVFHGEQQDPTNSWRSPANPYSYAKDGRRLMPRTAGDQVVRDVWVNAEKDDPDGDNTTDASTKAVTHDLLTNWKTVGGAAKLLWNVSRRRIETSPGQKLAERIDDRAVLKAWTERTDFATMMNTPIDGSTPSRNRSPQQYAKALEKIYRQMPTPLQDQMTLPLHTLNAARMLFGGVKRTLNAAQTAEPRFLSMLTKELPNVRFIVSGHDHHERVRSGNMAGKGNVAFIDSGTWTRTKGEDRLNVVVAHTDSGGRIKGEPELFRVNQTNGAPEFSPRAFEEQNQVDGWNERK